MFRIRPYFCRTILIPSLLMLRHKTRIEMMLDLSARLVERNKAFTDALKLRRPQTELKMIHSEIQEIYNHIALVRQQEREIV